jgi:hypothetical protein
VVALLSTLILVVALLSTFTLVVVVALISYQGIFSFASVFSCVKRNF